MNAAWVDTLITPWRRRHILASAGARSRSDVRFMELPQATIRYRTAGNGPQTLVLCTDPPVGLEMYDALLADLSRDFRVVIFEPPAFGFSLPRSGLDLAVPAVAAVTLDFFKRLGHGPYLLAFPCVTAYIALWLAGHHPEWVAGLVLMQAPDWQQELHWKSRRDPKGVLGTPWLGQLALKLVKRKRVDSWYATALGRRELLAPYTEQTRQSFDHGACFSLASAFQQMLSGPEPAFGAIRQPALLFWGNADRSHKHSDPESIRRYLPQARLVALDDAGHFPELESSARFSAELRQEFLTPAHR